MKTNIATDSLQSQRLLRYGVSADTADMAYCTIDSLLLNAPYVEMRDRFKETNCIPAWSLSALCELLFKSGHILSMQYERNEYRMQSFYSSGDFVTYGTTAIEACVNMIEKLTSNGYKLNEQ